MIAKGELNTCDIVTTNKSKEIKDMRSFNYGNESSYYDEAYAENEYIQNTAS